jgi:hypothetical protein
VKVRPGVLVLCALGLAVGIVAVSALREATLSTHERVDPRSRVEVLISARTEGGEPGQSLHEMVSALLLTCRLEVTADLVGRVHEEGDGRYRAVLAPSLDETNRRQFKGCIEDWTIDQLRADIVAFAPAGPER